MKKLLSVVLPGPALTFVNSWFDLFQKVTIFSNPDWQARGDNSAIAISVLATIIVSIICWNSPAEIVKNRAKYWLVAVCVLLFTCAAFYFFLDRPISRELSETLNLIWMFAYIAMLTAMVITLVYAALYWQATQKVSSD